MGRSPHIQEFDWNKIPNIGKKGNQEGKNSCGNKERPGTAKAISRSFCKTQRRLQPIPEVVVNEINENVEGDHDINAGAGCSNWEKCLTLTINIPSIQ